MRDERLAAFVRDVRRLLAGAEDGRDRLAGFRREDAVDDRHDAVRPELVAHGPGVEEVGDERFGDATVGQEELGVQVAPHDAAAVRELHDLAVDDGVLDAAGVVGELAAGEDGVQDDARGGLFFEEAVHDGLDAEDGVGRRFVGRVARVVGADEKDEGLRLVAVELAVVDAPEDVFGAVAAETELKRAVRLAREVLVPGRLAGAVPVVRDRVADEDDG